MSFFLRNGTSRPEHLKHLQRLSKNEASPLHLNRFSTVYNFSGRNRLFLNVFPPYQEIIEQSSRSRWNPRRHRNVQVETRTNAISPDRVSRRTIPGSKHR